ncbi:MAG: 50S ribosomal protein L32 [Parcubacteria group bacterium]
MALPGKRHPRALTHKRRSAWMSRLKPAQLAKCPKCATPKRPHVACHVCGYYKGQKVLDVKHRVTRAERRAAAKAAVAREKHEHAKEKSKKEPKKK